MCLSIGVKFMHRDIVWEWVDRAGLEHLSLTVSRDAITADGIVIFDFDGDAARLRYSVRCDGDWHVRGASLALDRRGEQHSTQLLRDDLGNWLADGAQRPDLAGCTDIDIRATPFTNTLPIRRLALRPGEASRVRVAYIGVPQLTIEAIDQEYTRLDRAAPPRRFRYRNLSNGFLAELEVDDEGVVIDYPGPWRRRCG